MKIEDLIKPTHVIAELKASGKRAVLQELAAKAGTALNLDAGMILKALLAREALGSTGMGDGFAIPHARLPEVKKPFGVCARLRKPIDFTSVDGRPVDLVFLLLLPTASQGDQLNALALVARRLRTPETAKRLRQSKGGAELFSALMQGEHTG